MKIDQTEFIFKFNGAVELQQPVTENQGNYQKHVGHYVAICSCDKSCEKNDNCKDSPEKLNIFNRS